MLRSLVLVIVGAAATVVAADRALRRAAPMRPRIMEVDDGVAEYRARDPYTLILGSSHSRSFLPVRRILAEERHDLRPIAVVPVEWGTMSSYDWVLQHRLRPLVEERARDGGLRRPSLRRALLVTTFYDLCSSRVTGAANLPARAWEAHDFVADLGDGLTDYNRNFLRERFRQIFGDLLLVQDRGYETIPSGLIDAVRPQPPAKLAARRAADVAAARQHVIEQFEGCDDGDEKRALLEMLDYLQGRDVEVTLVEFPLMPSLVSEQARATTLARYHRFAAGLARTRGLRDVDLTTSSPMLDADFQADFDHLNAAGNEKFARWALDHDLAFLGGPVAR